MNAGNSKKKEEGAIKRKKSSISNTNESILHNIHILHIFMGKCPLLSPDIQLLRMN